MDRNFNTQQQRLTTTTDQNQLTDLLISQVAQARSMLQTLGDRPEHESVDRAKVKVGEIDAALSNELEALVLMTRPDDVDLLQWKGYMAESESGIRRKAEEERRLYKSIIVLDEMHDVYKKMLIESEEKLVKIYDDVNLGDQDGDGVLVEDKKGEEELLSAEIVNILEEAAGKEQLMRRVDLSVKQLSVLPETFFGRVSGLVMLDLSNNQLQMIPDSIAWQETLEELDVSSNQLESLPETMGLLQNLKILNVSGNRLTALPDSISYCRSLVELDASYNNLTYLPPNIGYELKNLNKLSLQMNKIRALPSSIGEMSSLRVLDVHFNELHGLPLAIGKLSNLEILDLSSNFNDLTKLPETLCDLIKLKELDLSNNQIHALPDTFCHLVSLTKLSLDQNPITTPPPDVVKQGVKAVKIFMAKRWVDILDEEERKTMNTMKEQRQTGWVPRSTTWLNNIAAGVTNRVSEYLSPKTPKDDVLDRLL